MFFLIKNIWAILDNVVGYMFSLSEMGDLCAIKIQKSS